MITRTDPVIRTAIREENQMLRNENAELKEEIEQLTAKIHELQRPRDFLSTPFNTDISKLGLTINSQIGLSELGCKNLGDLVQLDAMTVRRTRKLGPTVAFRIEEQLKTMGLHFGMDLIHMSDKDFDDLVHRLQKMSDSPHDSTLPPSPTLTQEERSIDR